MMKILYITDDDVTRPNSGSAQRSAFLHKALCALGDVALLNPRDMGEGTFWRRLFAIPFRKLTKTARWPFGRSDREYAAMRLHLPPAPKRFDVIVCRYLDAAAEVNAWKLGPCYVDIDDLPIEAFDNVDGKRLPCLLRPMGRLLTSVWQRYCLGRCAGAWAISDEQCERLYGLRHGHSAALPNLAREPGHGYEVNAPQETMLMTVGLMGYMPNHEGVDWFLREIWPKVHARWPELKYAIAGGGVPSGRKARWSSCPNVEVLGFVDDLDALYAKSLAVVAPILSGAGTCIKVVEAGLHGRKVFATQVANRGLNLPNAVALFSNADEFIAKLDGWIKTPDRSHRQEKIADEARMWNSFEKFEGAVRKVLTRREDGE